MTLFDRLRDLVGPKDRPRRVWLMVDADGRTVPVRDRRPPANRDR